MGCPSIYARTDAQLYDNVDAAFWQGHKERILAGHVHDVFPYDQDKRFRRHRQSEAEAAEAGI